MPFRRPVCDAIIRCSTASKVCSPYGTFSSRISLSFDGLHSNHLYSLISHHEIRERGCNRTSSSSEGNEASSKLSSSDENSRTVGCLYPRDPRYSVGTRRYDRGRAHPPTSLFNPELVVNNIWMASYGTSPPIVSSPVGGDDRDLLLEGPGRGPLRRGGELSMISSGPGPPRQGPRLKAPSGFFPRHDSGHHHCCERTPNVVFPAQKARSPEAAFFA